MKKPVWYITIELGDRTWRRPVVLKEKVNGAV